MSLNEERNYQKMQETLEQLGLTENNRSLAAEYMDMSQQENPELLKKAEHQDFSRLKDDQREKSTAYVSHCMKRNREEELGRFVHLVSAVGGATAFYALTQYSWEISAFEKYMSLEQWAGVVAESRVWNAYTLSHEALKPLFEMGEKQPEILYKAQELCYHRYNNAKVLLSAIYLGSMKAAETGGGFLKNLFGKGEHPESAKVVRFLEEDVSDTIPSLFILPSLCDREIKELRAFLDTDKRKGQVPDSIMAIVKAHTVSEYLLQLLAGSAFLGMEHSKKLVSFLRLCLAVNTDLTLNACKGLAGEKIYSKRQELLEEILPVSGVEYVMWCLKNKRAKAVRRMAQMDSEMIRQAAKQSSVEGYIFLLESIRKDFPELYQELKTSYSENILEKTASLMVSEFTTGQSEAKAYLLGQGDLESLYFFVDGWRKQYAYDYRNFQALEKLAKGEPSFCRRALVLEALRLQTDIFSYSGLLKSNERGDGDSEKLTDCFEKEGLPLYYQLEAYDAIYSAMYNEKSKRKFVDTITESLAEKWDVYGEELRKQARNSTAVGRYLCILVLDKFWQQEKETLLACAQDTSKLVKEVLEVIYTGHREWEPEILQFLSSKKSREREIAVLVLKNWGIRQYRKELEEALEREKSKKLQELLRSCLDIESSAEDEALGSVRTPKEMADEILKGGKKRKIAWVFETPCTEVPLKDGNKAPQEYLQALLTAYADMPVPGFCPDAKKLAEELSSEKLAVFMAELFEKWLGGKAEAKKKWVLYAASIHGGDGIVPLIYHQIQEWPQNARGAIAAEAVKALALNGSSQALLLVDNISHKFKFRQVKTVAGEALSYAAEQMGLTKAELEDKIVPDLGFGEDFSRIFDYGTRTFTVYLTPALELEVFDKENKRLKTLPAPGKRDEEEKAAELMPISNS